ncbi:MAG TPA: ABC transporter permease, partial [Fimbriimonadaceae bacterium]|nr:ABC transporter permease [Fimbriimonadaceae bacterium]
MMEVHAATSSPAEFHDAPVAPPSATDEKPVVVLRPKKGFNPIPFRELWQFRDLLITLAQRDVKLRYRQTALGAIWVILQPLIGAGIFTFVFGKVANLPSPAGVPYFALTFASLLGWNVFANTMTKASSSLVGNSGLVSKVYFPRLILPISTSFGALVDFA